MEATDVLDVLAVLIEDGVSVVLDGGWGIDALLGAQHRDHADLDLVVGAEHLEVALAALAGVGFAVDDDHRPTRVTVADRDGRRVEFRVVGPEVDGLRWQVGGAPDGTDRRYPVASVTSGWVGGERVECIDAQLQVAHHQGYEATPRDVADLRLLQKQFGVGLPEGYW
jgi:lincosamide nucleotidyltransferase A/C/D/E